MVRLPEHDHCEYCGDAVAFDRRFCSEECVESYLRENRDGKRKNRLFYAFIAVSLMAIALIAVIVNL